MQSKSAGKKNWKRQFDGESLQDFPFLRGLSLSKISLFFLFFGIVVRSIQYLSNRSLWYDEAALALNIINRSYLELLGPLDNNQAAPPGFLFVEKFAVQVLGNNEYALRLFPFIAGIASIFLFYRYAKRYASPIAVPIAIALFACLDNTIYYAAEMKQYGIDLMGTLVLSLLLIPLRDRILSLKQMLGLTLVGVIFIWLSHPSIFVLSGIELISLLTAPNKLRQRLILNRLPIYVVWLLSFAPIYFLSIGATMQNPALQNSWGASYPDAPWDIIWLLDAFGRFFSTPLSFVSITDGIAFFAFICGCIAYYRSQRLTFLFLASPFLTMLLASYLHKYPFRDRLVFFLAPPALLFIAEGVVFLLTRLRQRWKYSTILGAIVLLALVIPPAIHATQLIFYPKVKEETATILKYVRSHQQPGDVFYLDRGATDQFLYYAEKFGYQEGDYVTGNFSFPRQIDNPEIWQHLIDDLAPVRGKDRVWLLLRAKYRHKAEISSHLDSIGRQLDFFTPRIDSPTQPSIFIYLYDLSEPPQ